MRNKIIIFFIILSGLTFILSLIVSLKTPDMIGLCGPLKDVGYRDGKYAYFYGYIEDKGIRTKVKFNIDTYSRYISGEKIRMCDDITSVSYKKITGKEYPGIDYSKIKNSYTDSLASIIVLLVSYLLFIIFYFSYFIINE